MRGRFWFVECDLKAGSTLKLDKSGRALLMTLRHLGRIQEVRCADAAAARRLARCVCGWMDGWSDKRPCLPPSRRCV